jgi:hypothetical protein
MNLQQKREILKKVQSWFEQVIVTNHIANSEKLTNPDEFNVNPFLAPYLAGFFTGELSPESIAKVLVYPRILGTSITTSFGTNMQRFVSDVLGSVVGSMVQGIDIEFVDAIDGRRKYCQAKLGPNTINKDDIVTIHNHFKAARLLGRTNNVTVRHDDLIVGILYGEPGEESSHYKKLRDDHGYPLFMGKEFWHRLTGDEEFYTKLQEEIAKVAIKANGKKMIENVVNKLASTEAVKKISCS